MGGGGVLCYNQIVVYELTVEQVFSAAHELAGYAGPCARLHGHNFKVAVTVTGVQLDDLGMLTDFGQVRSLLSGVLDRLDHSHLNALPEFAHRNPTSEHLAQLIYAHMREILAATAGLADRVRVSRVSVHESDRAAATYFEAD